MENGQPLCDHFKAMTVNTPQRNEVPVPHEDVGGDTSSSLTADACNRLRLPYTPEIETRWWPKMSRGRPHRQVREKRERKKKTANHGWGRQLHSTRKRGRASAAACHSGGQDSAAFSTGQRSPSEQMDHPEAVRPTGPMCGFLRPGGASKPTTSKGQKQ